MNGGQVRSLIIETPEGVVFSYSLASPITRALAWIIDIAAISVMTKAANQVCEWLGYLNGDWATATSVIMYFLISVGYGVVLEWRWRGQTIGKRTLGLRVIDAQGLKLQLSQIVLRNLLRLIDMLPLAYLVGGLVAFFSKNCQRLGDIAAGTIVTRERTRQEPDLERVAPAKYNSLLAYPHLTARLRNAATPDSVNIAVQAVSRRDGYDPLARVELFRELAAHFQSLAPFPAAASEGLTDEQYVRSVLRVIYEKAGTRPVTSRIGPDVRSPA